MLLLALSYLVYLLHFNRLWALCPCNKVQSKEDYHTGSLTNFLAIFISYKMWASVSFMSVTSLPSPWSQWIGIDWALNPGFPQVVQGSMATQKHSQVFLSPCTNYLDYNKINYDTSTYPREMDMWLLTKHVWTSQMWPYCQDRKPGGRPQGLYTHWMVADDSLAECCFWV